MKYTTEQIHDSVVTIGSTRYVVERVYDNDFVLTHIETKNKYSGYTTHNINEFIERGDWKIAVFEPKEPQVINEYTLY